MDRYKQNVRWLMLLAPFRNLSISAAYLTPFFLQNGLNLSEMLLLQSIFSGAYLAWEIPSGWIADRIGRARSIKLSAPIATIGLLAYGFCDQFWQFTICELILAIANGLISGVDTALLVDSLRAEGKADQFVRISQRINAIGYATTAIGVPIAMALVHFWGVRATVIADGLLTSVCIFVSLRLHEAPRCNGGQEAVRLSAWRATQELIRNVEARWLVLFGAVLSTATYLAFWLSASYYASLGISTVWFGALLAVRSFWKAWLSHKVAQERHLERNMVGYALLAATTYFAMASGHWWLLWLVLGHDTIQALASQPIVAKLNEHIAHDYRATMNSLVNLIQRLLYAVTGPLLGSLVDHSITRGFVIAGIISGFASMVAVLRLRQLRTFQM